MKRFSINQQGVATYVVDEKMPGVDIDLNAVFNFANLNELAQKALTFAVGHIFRNATAGKMEGDKTEALKAVQERAKALAEGKWAAHRETGEAGEARTSLLAQALAAVMQVEAKDAAEFISSEIRKALEENGIDPDASGEDLSAEEKSKQRKIAAEVRKSISDDPAVNVKLTALRAAAAAEKAANAAKAAEGKASKFA